MFFFLCSIRVHELINPSQIDIFQSWITHTHTQPRTLSHTPGGFLFQNAVMRHQMSPGDHLAGICWKFYSQQMLYTKQEKNRIELNRARDGKKMKNNSKNPCGLVIYSWLMHFFRFHFKIFLLAYKTKRNFLHYEWRCLFALKKKINNFFYFRVCERTCFVPNIQSRTVIRFSSKTDLQPDRGCRISTNF